MEQSSTEEVGTNEATSPSVYAERTSTTDKAAPVTALSSRTQAMASSESRPSVCSGVAAVNARFCTICETSWVDRRRPLRALPSWRTRRGTAPRWAPS